MGVSQAFATGDSLASVCGLVLDPEDGKVKRAVILLGSWCTTGLLRTLFSGQKSRPSARIAAYTADHIRRFVFFVVLIIVFLCIGPFEVHATPQSDNSGNYCNRQRPSNVGMGTAALVQSWQPRGGQIMVAINKQPALPANATIYACFEWRNARGRMTQSPAVKLNSFGIDGSRSLEITVPDLADAPARSWEKLLDGDGGFTGFGLVPVANMRILAIDDVGNIVFDETQCVGITTIWLGISVAIAAVLLLFIVLARIELPGVQTANPFFRVVATADGYASLSQFQVLLWTLTIGGSAIYVMALSGELINIPPGALVLLGISGIATLGADIAAKAQQTRDAVTQKNEGTAPAPLKRSGGPRFSDLFESNGIVEVARVQMLFFTLIAASFVIIKVVASFTIPEIPDGILVLMGISNGVYLGAKATVSSAPSAVPSGGQS